MDSSAASFTPARMVLKPRLSVAAAACTRTMPLLALAGRAALRAMRPIWLFAFIMVAAMLQEAWEKTERAREQALTTARIGIREAGLMARPDDR